LLLLLMMMMILMTMITMMTMIILLLLILLPLLPLLLLRLISTATAAYIWGLVTWQACSRLTYQGIDARFATLGTSDHLGPGRTVALH
jgi:hypothetical protein